MPGISAMRWLPFQPGATFMTSAVSAWRGDSSRHSIRQPCFRSHPKPMSTPDWLAGPRRRHLRIGIHRRNVSFRDVGMRSAGAEKLCQQAAAKPSPRCRRRKRGRQIGITCVASRLRNRRLLPLHGRGTGPGRGCRRGLSRSDLIRVTSSAARPCKGSVASHRRNTQPSPIGEWARVT